MAVSIASAHQRDSDQFVAAGGYLGRLYFKQLNRNRFSKEQLSKCKYSFVHFS
jgi:hypothetical protein